MSHLYENYWKEPLLMISDIEIFLFNSECTKYCASHKPEVMSCQGQQEQYILTSIYIYGTIQ